MKLMLCFLSLIYTVNGHSQGMEAKKLVEAVKDKQNNISHYEADVLVHVDVDFIHINDKTIHIRYEAPDQFDVDAKGFVMLPKKGVKHFLDEYLHHDYLALLTGEEIIRDHTVKVIKIIPASPDSEFVLATLWITPVNKEIIKANIHTRKEGNYELQFFYEDDNPFGLPSKTIVNFEISRFSLPLKFIGKINFDKQALKQEEITKGSVTLTYMHYLIEEK